MPYLLLCSSKMTFSDLHFFPAYKPVHRAVRGQRRPADVHLRQQGGRRQTAEGRQAPRTQGQLHHPSSRKCRFLSKSFRRKMTFPLLKNNTFLLGFLKRKVTRNNWKCQYLNIENYYSKRNFVPREVFHLRKGFPQLSPRVFLVGKPSSLGVPHFPSWGNFSLSWKWKQLCSFRSEAWMCEFRTTCAVWDSTTCCTNWSMVPIR